MKLVCDAFTMTLEDFFTLTEIKYGLTAPDRVNELVNAMQKEKDCFVKNINDATRQWSTVATTIAATENRDCLDRFIQLGGLSFIGRWLKDAQGIGNDNGFAEESIVALLRALETLNINNDLFVSSGIWITVKSLIGHSSPHVKDRARAVFDRCSYQNVEKVNECLDVSKRNSEASGDDVLPSINSNDVLQERIEGAQIEKLDAGHSPPSEGRVSNETVSSPAVEFQKANESELDSKDGECCTSNLSRSIANKFVPEPKKELGDDDECTVEKNVDPDSMSSPIEYTEAVDAFKKQDAERGEQSSKPLKNSKDLALADMELEYGLVDALEVARTVAEEVAREVLHYKDSLSSSSSDKDDQSTISPPHEASLKEGDGCLDPENHEPEMNSEKRPCSFDLNQEVCPEEIEQYVNPIKTVVSVVSASRPSAGTELPVSSGIRFEGSLGWKGSAKTSAFRSASPRRAPDSERLLLEQRQGVLNIDLNVAGVDEDEISSSGEANPRISWDLNLACDVEDGLSPESSHQSPPPSSSTRYIDLNDPSCCKPVSDDPVVSILGRRVEVGRREFSPPETLFPFQNGNGIATEAGPNSCLFGPPYAGHLPPQCGFNGLGAGPSTSFYGGPGGWFPSYMVDSRGAFGVPQMVTSGPSYPQPPFLMNHLPGPPLGLNGGPGGFDLNSGFVGKQLFGHSDGKLMMAEEHVWGRPQASLSLGSLGLGGKRKEPETAWEPCPFVIKKQPRLPPPPWI